MTDTAAAQHTDEEVDLLLFEVGNAVYGVDASLVVRVDRATEGALNLPALGKLTHGTRALVFTQDGSTQQQLRVDGVRGVKTVRADALRRIPPATGARHYAIGFWLEDGEHPVLLIDLHATSSQ